MRVNGSGMAPDYNSLVGDLGKPLLVDKPSGEKLRHGDQPREAANIRESQPANEEQLGKAVDLANVAMEISNYNLEFKVHEESGRIQVKVIDNKSKEVVREIPPERMLELSAGIKEMLEKFQKMVGLLVDELV